MRTTLTQLNFLVSSALGNTVLITMALNVTADEETNHLLEYSSHGFGVHPQTALNLSLNDDSEKRV